MFLCTGLRTTIVQAMIGLRGGEEARRIERRSEEIFDFGDAEPCARIVLAGGHLAGLSDAQHTRATRVLTRQANFVEPMMIASQAIHEIPGVRICIIGSRSADGSYDTEYAKWKLMIQNWAERQALHPSQQLVVVAPPIIADSGMTERRHDYPGVLAKRDHCFAIDVARRINELLWADLSPEIQKGTFRIEPTVVVEPGDSPSVNWGAE